MADIEWTTEQVRNKVVHHAAYTHEDLDRNAQRWAAWLAAHDAEVARNAVAKALGPIQDLLDSEDRSQWIMPVVWESDLRAALDRADRSAGGEQHD